MTNPNNALGTNGAYGGRTSVNAFNDVLASFAGRGVLSGWACVPSSDMTVELGGSGEERDVAIAENNTGDKTTVNNISVAPVPITLNAAPASNSRIDSIVAYVINPPEGEATAADNPGAVGLIAVSGTVASSPSAPTESAIRSAITADGASGSTAYYVVLANVRVAAGTTTVTADMITAGESAVIGAQNIDFTTMPITLPFWENDNSTISSLPWTAPDNCVVIAAISADETGGKVLYVNGCRAAQTNISGYGSSNALAIPIFMRKGDVLSQSASGQIAYAYWHKLSY